MQNQSAIKYRCLLLK